MHRAGRTGSAEIPVPPRGDDQVGREFGFTIFQVLLPKQMPRQRDDTIWVGRPSRQPQPDFFVVIVFE